MGRNCFICNTELYLLVLWTGTVTNRGLTFTPSLIVIMISLTYASSVYADSAFRANHTSTRIRSHALSVHADFMFTALDTSTWIIWNTGSILAGRGFWTLDACTWIVWHANTILASTTIAHYASTRVRNNALSVDTSTSFTNHSITRIGRTTISGSATIISGPTISSAIVPGHDTLSVDTGSGITYHSSTWIWSYALTINTGTSITLDSCTRVRSYTGSILAGCRRRTSYTSARIIRNTSSILAG